MELVMRPIETALAMVGLTSPVSRFVAFTALGGLVEWSLRDMLRYSYDDSGSPRPFALLAGRDAPGATYLPAGLTAALIGFFFGFFV